MTEKHRIWQDDVARHVATMDKARNVASAGAASELYEGACLDFGGYVADRFGSAAGFAAFLENETRSAVESKGLSSAELKHLDWSVQAATPVEEAERGAAIFRENYSRTMDDLAYITQFRHAEPAFAPHPV